MALSSHVFGSPEEQPLGGSASVDEIRLLIADLGNPSYEKRTFATRRLCAIGSGAREQLLVAAAGADVETSLRAKAVLSVLDQLMFDGVEVRLSFAKSKIAWDEPLDLVITLSNHSEYPARVPFEIGNGRSTATEPARQVGDMLDAAEFLLVQHENGKRIELVVDGQDLVSEGDESNNSYETTVECGGLMVEAGPSQNIPLGAVYTITGAYVESADAGDVFSATVDWDDGEGPRPAGVVQATGEITGSHTYASTDYYEITVRVTNQWGDEGSDETSVSVTP